MITKCKFILENLVQFSYFDTNHVTNHQSNRKMKNKTLSYKLYTYAVGRVLATDLNELALFRDDV